MLAGTFVLPRMIAPADLMRLTITPSSGAMKSFKRFIRFLRARTRVCLEEMHDGVQLAVVRSDARQEGLGDLCRRDLPIADPPRELRGSREAEIRARRHR